MGLQAKKIALSLGMTVLLSACAETPSPISEVVGETVQYEIPLGSGFSDAGVAMTTMMEVKTQVYDFMNKPEYGSIEKVYVLVKQPDDERYALGFSFNRSDLKHLDFENDMPFQNLMPLADIDKKMQNGRQIMDAWCNENKEYINICT